MSKRKIFNQLGKLYPAAESELNFTNEYQLIIAVALSAQCTDKKVNQVTVTLFQKYPDFAALAKAKISSLEKIIREVNYYKTKSRNIKNLAKLVMEKHQGIVPDTFKELEALPGVGHKTASVVLGEKGIPALPVDTHVFRVANRLGLANGKNVVEVEQQLKAGFPKKDWRDLHHRLIFHGRRICKAQKPLCEECSLIKLCTYANE